MITQPTALRIADELDDWSDGPDTHLLVEEAAAEMRRLYAENESLRADAERYRWLRETRFIWSDFSYISGVHPTTVGIEFRWFATDSKKPTRDDLDKAITAAKHGGEA